MKPQNKTIQMFLKNLQIENETNKNFQGEQILAIDYGEKKTGLAYSPDGICAIPKEIIPTESLEEWINKKIQEKKIQKIVWGLPLLPDGQENTLCKTIQEKAKAWEKEIPTKFINERFSTKLSLPQKNKKRQDDSAATRILEFYLSKK